LLLSQTDAARESGFAHTGASPTGFVFGSVIVPLIRRTFSNWRRIDASPRVRSAPAGAPPCGPAGTPSTSTRRWLAGASDRTW